MTKQQAGRIKAKLTRAGWYIAGELYDRPWREPDSVLVAVIAAPDVFEEETNFYSLAQCPSPQTEKAEVSA